MLGEVGAGLARRARRYLAPNPTSVAPFQSGWTTPAQLTPTPGGTQGVAVASYGASAYALWCESGATKFKKSLDDGATWWSPVTVDSSSDGPPLEETLFCAPNGNIHAVYARGNLAAGGPCALLHRYSKDAGSTWSAETVLDSGASYGNNRFWRVGSVCKIDGSVHIFAASASFVTFITNGLRYFKSTDGGATFSAGSQPFASAVTPQRPSMAVSAGALHVTWMDSRDGTAGNSAGEIYYARSTDNGATWTETRLTNTSPTFDTERPAIRTGRGGVTVVYNFGGASADLYMVRSPDDGVTWGTPVPMRSFANTQEHSWIEQDGLAFIWSWADSRTSPEQSYIWFSWDGGLTWTTEEIPQPSADIQPAPRLALTTNALIHVIQRQGGSGYFYTRKLR